MEEFKGELRQQREELSIHQKCFSGDFAAIKAFINENQTAINKKDSDGRTLLHWACSGSRQDIVSLLLESNIKVDVKDDEGMNELMIAAAVGNLEIVKLLSSKMKDCVNYAGKNSLFYCASKGHYDILVFLVKNGSDLNQQDKQGQTCLYRAVVKGSLSIVKFLVENGAHLNHLDQMNESPLHFAIEAEQVIN
jgi:ankyrin repeat protein